MFVLECGDVCLIEPDRDFDRHRHAVVAQLETLQRLMAQLVVANGWDDQRSGISRRVLLAVNDDARRVCPRWRRLRRPRLRVVITTKQVVWARRRNALQEVGEPGEGGVASSFVVESICTNEVKLRPMVRVGVDLG
jgi:hypothetical protein